MIAADYTGQASLLPPEQVAPAVEAAKQREQVEKAHKRPWRSSDHGGR